MTARLLTAAALLCCLGAPVFAAAPAASVPPPPVTKPSAAAPTAQATPAVTTPADAAAAAPGDTPVTAVAPAPAQPQFVTPRPVQPAAPAAAQTSGSAAGSLMQTTFALLFVLALMLGAAWFLKRFGPKNFGGGNSNVKLVGSLSVGTRERILVVEVGEQWIVVGASPGRMNALATMPRQESSEPAATVGVPTANFAEWFKQTIDKRNGK